MNDTDFEGYFSGVKEETAAVPGTVRLSDEVHQKNRQTGCIDSFVTGLFFCSRGCPTESTKKERFFIYGSIGMHQDKKKYPQI